MIAYVDNTFWNEFFCVCKFFQNGNIIIWQVSQCFSENGVGAIRERTVKVLVEVGKGSDYACVTWTMMDRTGEILLFLAGSILSPILLSMSDMSWCVYLFISLILKHFKHLPEIVMFFEAFRALFVAMTTNKQKTNVLKSQTHLELRHSALVVIMRLTLK